MRELAGPLLEAVSTRALVVAPIRIALGLAGLAAAAATATDPEAALIGFLLGVLAMLVVILADPRRQFLRLREEPPPPPADARYARPAQLAASAVFPSTVGVALLTAVAVPFRPELAAVLAGALVGMGLAATMYGMQLRLRERSQGTVLYVEQRTHRPYLRVQD